MSNKYSLRVNAILPDGALQFDFMVNGRVYYVIGFEDEKIKQILDHIEEAVDSLRKVGKYNG